jgi:TonB family protein
MTAGLQPKNMMISGVMHVSIFALFLLGNPFGGKEPPKFDVLTVKLASMPAPQKIQEAKPKPPPKKKPPKKKVVKKKPPIKNPKKVEEKTVVPPVKTEEPTAEDLQPALEEPDSQVDADTSTTEFSEKVSNAEFTGAFDNNDFTYTDWTSRAFGKIQRNWRNYASASHPLACVIQFRVLMSGSVYGVAIRESSGNGIFDQGCLNAVKRAGKLPPLPPEYQREEIGIALKFPWKPR